EQGPDGMEIRIYDLVAEAANHVEHGANILILSDRNLGPERVASPSLLAVAAVHHHLVRGGTRLRTGLVIESGEPRNIHHMATLIGYGAAAINPYVMFESIDELADRSLLPEDQLDGSRAADESEAGRRARRERVREEAERRIVKAIGKGLMKTISKMGISTLQHAVGAAAPAQAQDGGHAERGASLDGGQANGSRNGGGPDRAPREIYAEYAQMVNDDAGRKGLLRGLMKLRPAAEPVPLEEV